VKTIHWQIYGAVATVGAVGALVLLLQASGTNSDLERQLARAKERPAPAAAPAQTARQQAPTESEDTALLRTRISQLERRVKDLSADNARLQKENADLKAAVAAASHASTTADAGDSGAAGTSGGTALQPLAMGDGAPASPTGAPPTIEPTAPTPSGEPWGASEEGELDKLAGALNLDQPQREEVKRIILQAQNEFEKRLIEASQSGERDIMIIERIGEEVSKNTEQRIRQILRPGQQENFDRYLAEQQ
jgi:hypothetical protein